MRYTVTLLQSRKGINSVQIVTLMMDKKCSLCYDDNRKTVMILNLGNDMSKKGTKKPRNIDRPDDYMHRTTVYIKHKYWRQLQEIYVTYVMLDDQRTRSQIFCEGLDIIHNRLFPKKVEKEQKEE